MQLPFGRKEAPRAKKGAGVDDTRGKAAKKGGSKQASSKASSAGKKRSGSEREGSTLFGAPALIMGPRLLFIFAVVALCVLGLVMIYSASSITAYADSDFGNDSTYFFKKQLTWLTIGLGCLLACAFIPYRLWANVKVAWFLQGVAMFLLALVALGLGNSLYGAERSISLGPFSLQPAEFAKISMLIFIGAQLESARQGEQDLRRAVVVSGVVGIITLLLIYKQPDLGTAMILFMGILALLALYGVKGKVIAGLCGAVLIYFIAVCVLQPYHMTRIFTFLDPWADAQGNGYQSIQGFLAFGSGGIFGTGLGLSRQKYEYLPFAYNDFIYAVIGEELGLVGALATLLLFALFIYAGLRISHMAPDIFAAALSGGMTTMVGFQACLNMACVVGMAPVTGKALPFISYGGSSLMATMIMAGLVLGVSRASRLDIASERRRDNLLVMEGGRSAARQLGSGEGERAAGRGAAAQRVPERPAGAQSGRLQGQAYARYGSAGSAARGRNAGGSAARTAAGAASRATSRAGQAGAGGAGRTTTRSSSERTASSRGSSQASQRSAGSQGGGRAAQGARRSPRGSDLDIELIDVTPRSGRSSAARSSSSTSSRRSGAQGSSSNADRKQVRYDGRPKRS